MIPNDPDDKLGSLTGRQREVLRLFCDGLKYADIARELVISENTVKTHMGNIYVKLGLEYLDDGPRKKALHEVFCRALKEEVIEPTGEIVPPDEPEPEPVPAHVMALVIRDENALVPVPSGRVISIRPVPATKPPRQPRRGRWLLFGMILGTALTGCVVYASWQALLWLDARFGPRAATVVSQLTGVPTDQSTETASADTTEAPTAIVSPTTELVVVNTLPPEQQPTQTNAPATPTGPTVLFQDNFDTGLSEYWEVLSGSPVVVNGRLTANEPTWLAIGDPSWDDYIIEFDADAAGCWFGSNVDTVAVRFIDINNMIAWRWEDCESYWYIVDSGKDNQVPKSGSGTGYGMIGLRIIVDGDKFSAFQGDKLLSSFFDRRFPKGRVALKVNKNTLIDNFIIKLIE